MASQKKVHLEAPVCAALRTVPSLRSRIMANTRCRPAIQCATGIAIERYTKVGETVKMSVSSLENVRKPQNPIYSDRKWVVGMHDLVANTSSYRLRKVHMAMQGVSRLLKVYWNVKGSRNTIKRPWLGAINEPWLCLPFDSAYGAYLPANHRPATHWMAIDMAFTW